MVGEDYEEEESCPAVAAATTTVEVSMTLSSFPMLDVV
jgi:hypothetical protein